MEATREVEVGNELRVVVVAEVRVLVDEPVAALRVEDPVVVLTDWRVEVPDVEATAERVEVPDATLVRVEVVLAARAAAVFWLP